MAFGICLHPAYGIWYTTALIDDDSEKFGIPFNNLIVIRQEFHVYRPTPDKENRRESYAQ